MRATALAALMIFAGCEEGDSGTAGPDAGEGDPVDSAPGERDPDAQPGASCSGRRVLQVSVSMFDLVCAVIDDGSVLCRGGNLYGELGRGFTTPAGDPAPGWGPVADIDDAVEVATGDAFTCVRSAGGQVRCFGKNALGQLGNGNVPDDSNLPGDPIMSGATALDAGRYAACATTTGATLCWGYDMASNLSSATFRSTPVADVRLPSAAAAIALGEQAACGHAGQTVQCARYLGGLGPDTAIDFALPLGAGLRHFCAARADGRTMCWGQNFDSQLGDGTTDDADAGVLASNLAEPDAITGGWGHTCALESGTVSCWGSNVGGLLGRGFVSAREPVPAPIPDLADVVQIDSGYYRTCAVTSSGSLYCWGGGELDDPATVASSPGCIDLAP